MSTGAEEQLRKLLGREELSWLVERLRDQLAEGRSLGGTVTLAGASDAQRQAVARLLGRPPGRGASVTIHLPTLEGVLRRAGLAPDLPTAVQVLIGPVPKRSAERSAREAAWASAYGPIEDLAERRPPLAGWAATLRATGLLRRLAAGDPERARLLAAQAVRVLDRLPAGGVPLSMIASAAAGDGHALDEGRPLSSLVLRAAAALSGIVDGMGAEWRRTVWAAVGVLCGELTSPVLTLNLPGDGRTATGRALTIWGETGQPVHLSARQLLHHPPELRLAGHAVFVCENPAVVAEAANRLSGTSAPLVCASTHPAAAATLLLRRLREAGAELRYHGDLDWPGVTIANGILSRFRARPWRLDARAYRAAVEAGWGGAPLRGTPARATWDPDLEPAMRALGVRVEEEAVMEELLEDLASRA